MQQQQTGGAQTQAQSQQQQQNGGANQSASSGASSISNVDQEKVKNLKITPKTIKFYNLKIIYLFLGSVNHASIAAYRRTNSHFTSRTETEYFNAQGTDRPKCWRIIITDLVFFSNISNNSSKFFSFSSIL